MQTFFRSNYPVIVCALFAISDDIFCALFAISISHYFHIPNQEQLEISGRETMTSSADPEGEGTGGLP